MTTSCIILGHVLQRNSTGLIVRLAASGMQSGTKPNHGT
jgi:hypothetical protein